MSEYTRWFSIEKEPPAREGVYQVTASPRHAPRYSNWRAKAWRFTENSVEKAESSLGISYDVQRGLLKLWRGLILRPTK